MKPRAISLSLAFSLLLAGGAAHAAPITTSRSAAHAPVAAAQHAGTRTIAARSTFASRVAAGTSKLFHSVGKAFATKVRDSRANFKAWNEWNTPSVQRDYEAYKRAHGDYSW